MTIAVTSTLDPTDRQREITAVLTRYYFFMDKNQQAIVMEHMYEKKCPTCKNKRIDKTNCDSCHGVGKVKLLSITEKIEEIAILFGYVK